VGFLSLFSMMLFETPTLPQTSFHWVSVIVMGIFLTGFAYIVSNASQGVIPALNVTIIYTLEPFFASLFGWMLLSEAISANTVLGAVLIFLSMLTPALMNQNRRKTAQSLT
ncbi:DMT family transporter, partial [Aduncisulcus paluster]